MTAARSRVSEGTGFCQDGTFAAGDILAARDESKYRPGDRPREYGRNGDHGSKDRCGGEGQFDALAVEMAYTLLGVREA